MTLKKNFSGRASLEAANLGIKLKDDEVAFRCNLVTVKDGTMVDYSAGHISSDEAKILLNICSVPLIGRMCVFIPAKVIVI